MLKAWSEGDNFIGFASFILAEKLKVVKSKLKEWNNCSFGMQKRRLTDCPWKRWML